jgi:glycosyltransferase involved in cell wall biosynthesis
MTPETQETSGTRAAGAPTVSVIIPAYNAAGFVSRAIESALAQTHPPLEILVIDDGSKDATSEVVARFAPPVRLLRQPNGGPAAARNHGAREARGEWLAFLDADDRWLPEKLAGQLARATDPGVALVYSRLPVDPAPNHGGRVIPPVADFATLWRRNYLITSAVMVRLAVFERHGGFDEDRALIGVEDYNLWLRLAASGERMVLCPEEHVIYSPAPGSLTRQVERFLGAELTNLARLAERLHIDARTVADKRQRLYLEYGRELFWVRDLGAARRCFARTLAERPAAQPLAWWMATFLPGQVIDLRRRWRGRGGGTG